MLEGDIVELVVLTKEEIVQRVADEITALIKEKPHCVLGLATGSTPVGVYDELIRRYQKGLISFQEVKTYNLDEYVGLSGNDPQSYRYFMNNVFFNHIDIKMANTHVPNGVHKEESIALYDEAIDRDGGIDFQILGIGRNGHIAFNEPGTSFQSTVHIVHLDEKTRKDNARFFENEEDVPTEAITMGLASIMKAKRIVLLSFGKNKAEAIAKLFLEIENENLPASILKRHNNVIIYCDKDSVSLLESIKRGM